MNGRSWLFRRCRGSRTRFLVVEQDLDQRAAGEPIVEILARNTAGRLWTVLRLEDFGEHSLASRLVHDGQCCGGQVRRHPVFEMNNELRMGSQVRVPAARAWYASQIPVAVDTVEPDLDASGVAALRAPRGDLDCVLRRGGIGSDLQGARYCWVQAHGMPGRSRAVSGASWLLMRRRYKLEWTLAQAQKEAHVAGDELTIGQVSEQTGLTVHTLRYYEREGVLLGPVPRSAAGRRTYSELDVRWLLLCNRFRSCGMPISDIRRYAELVATGPGNEDQRMCLLREHEQRVRNELKHLTETLTIIESKASLYERHLKSADLDQLWTDQTPECLAIEALAVPGR
jgi:DNA-binding transcriptional MerR regulator